MKQKTSLLALLALSAVIAFTSCKKEKDADNNNAVEIIAHSDDQTLFTAELDEANLDAETVLAAYAVTYSGRNQEPPVYICDASISFNAESNPRTITVQYNGENCKGSKKRTGTIVLSFAEGTDWNEAGAAVSVSFQNFKVTRLSDNKSITINGTQTYTNVSGGLLKNLSSQQSITHSITSNDLSVAFDNANARTWKVAKQHVYTYSNGIVLSASGTHSEGGQNNIAEWGTNRFGLAFSTATVEPVVIRQDCDFRITGGVVKHTVANVSATATFGLDAKGEPVSCPEGSYYFKLVYTGPAGNSISFLYPY